MQKCRVGFAQIAVALSGVTQYNVIKGKTKELIILLEIIFTVLAIWLFAKAVKLALRLTWGAAKIAAICLLVLAVPVFILLLIFAGGLLLLLPVALIVGVIALIKACT